MNHNRIQILAFFLLALCVVFAGPLVSLMNTSRIDPSVLEIWIGILAVVGAFLWMFRYHILSVLLFLRTRVGGIEDDITYPALPQGPILEDQGYYPPEEVPTSQEETEAAADEDTLPLAPGCPLPFQSALTHHLIVEQTGRGRKGRAVATRKYLELLHNIPMLVVASNPSFATLLPECSNGWLASSSKGEVHAAAKAQLRYATVTPQNAANFGTKMLRSMAQVVLDVSSYDETEALSVVSSILAGMRAMVKEQGPYACLLVFTDAHKWSPDNVILDQERSRKGEDLVLAKKVREQIYELISTEETTGLYVYLATHSLYHMDLRSVRGCRLWTLNLPYDRLTPGDIAFICYHSGLSEEQLAHLNEHTILVDVDSRTSMEIQMYMHRTAHEETGVSSAFPPDLSRVEEDLSHVANREVASLGKPGAEADQEGERWDGGSASAAAHEKFSWQQFAYAVALQEAGHFTETALRRPPSTKMVGNTQITCADLAQELGLKQPFSDKDLMGRDRAAELLDIVEGRSEEELTQEERSVYMTKASEALTAIAERRGPVEVAFSDQSGDGGGGTSLSRWPLPPSSLLIAPEAVKTDVRNEVNEKGRILQETLSGFGVAAQVLEEYSSIGPKVVRFGVLPTGKDERRTKVEQITRLKKDIQRVLQAKSIRMLDPVPGTPYVGIEMENPSPTIVRLREILESTEYQLACARSNSRLVIVLGRDVAGRVRFFDLAKAPHVLIAGTTGGGKSVCVDTILCSLLMRTTPEDVQLVLVDPKMVGLSFYNEIPHLLGPVITDVTTVAPMLRSIKQRMQARYEFFRQLRVRDLEEYRQLRAKRRRDGDNSLKPIPAYVVLIDELANIMLAEKDEVEPLLCDITAMGRAAGIHVILATQRPIVEVITGTMKNNIPTRIGFMVPQAIDSRVILDQGGAEILLGQGDMLYLSEGTPAAERMQCALTETAEVERITQYWQNAKPLRDGEMEPIDAAHMGQLLLQDWATPAAGEEVPGNEQDDQLATLIKAFLNGGQLDIKLSDLDNEQLYCFVQPWTSRQNQVSNQDLMFTFSIGQPRAAKLMSWLQRDGIVGPDRGAGRKREVHVRQDEQNDVRWDEPVETPV